MSYAIAQSFASTPDQATTFYLTPSGDVTRFSP
jgi:hypothetical protein